MKPEEAQPFINHLEFLGYSINIVEENEEIIQVIGYSNVRNNLFLYVHRSPILAGHAFGIQEEDLQLLETFGMGNFFLVLSERLIYGKCRGIRDDQDKINSINSEMIYAGAYDRVKFGEFLEILESQTRGFIDILNETLAIAKKKISR